MSLFKALKRCFHDLTGRKTEAPRRMPERTAEDEALALLATCADRTYINTDGDTRRYTIGQELFFGDVEPVLTTPFDLLDARLLLTAGRHLFVDLQNKAQATVRIPPDVVFPCGIDYWAFSTNRHDDRPAMWGIIDGQEGWLVPKDRVEVATVLRTYDRVLNEIEKGLQARPASTPRPELIYV